MIQRIRAHIARLLATAATVLSFGLLEVSFDGDRVGAHRRDQGPEAELLAPGGPEADRPER